MATPPRGSRGGALLMNDLRIQAKKYEKISFNLFTLPYGLCKRRNHPNPNPYREVFGLWRSCVSSPCLGNLWCGQSTNSRRYYFGGIDQLEKLRQSRDVPPRGLVFSTYALHRTLISRSKFLKSGVVDWLPIRWMSSEPIPKRCW